MPTATAEKTKGQDAKDEFGGYLVLKEATIRDVNGDSSVHLVGVVLSTWEVEEFVRGKVAEGSHHYRSILEPLTAQEVHEYRAKATALEGDHYVDGQHVSPPWPDYVGLHPEEVIERMRLSSSRDECKLVRLYEQGGLGRPHVLEYTAPCERPPWVGYDELNVREVIEKLGVLSDAQVHEALAYESAHRRRPAIITYEPDSKS